MPNSLALLQRFLPARWVVPTEQTKANLCSSPPASSTAENKDINLACGQSVSGPCCRFRMVFQVITLPSSMHAFAPLAQYSRCSWLISMWDHVGVSGARAVYAADQLVRPNLSLQLSFRQSCFLFNVGWKWRTWFLQECLFRQS